MLAETAKAVGGVGEVRYLIKSASEKVLQISIQDCVFSAASEFLCELN